MTPTTLGLTLSVGLDLFPMIAAVLSAVSCAILGNFLVLRRQSLMGDAISHSVLPGLVIAFLITSTRSPLAMFLGATIAGIATVILVELIKKLGRVEPGAAMGVVFSVLFALGVLLIEQAAARHVDLDAQCVLYGQLETLAWYDAPHSITEIWSTGTLDAIPRQVSTLLIVCLVTIGFTVVLFKELRIVSFDPALATTLGYNASVLHFVLMVLVAIATVASFEAVGSILVIAMLVCPASCARLMTDSLRSQVMWSVVFAVLSAVLGYLGSLGVPAWFGRDSVNAAGSIALMSGVLLVCTIVVSPSHGLLARAHRARSIARQIRLDDLLVRLLQDSGRVDDPIRITEPESSARDRNRAIQTARKLGLVTGSTPIELTEKGTAYAHTIANKHDQWESYLIARGGLDPEHAHDRAHTLEHLDLSPETRPANRSE